MASRWGSDFWRIKGDIEEQLGQKPQQFCRLDKSMAQTKVERRGQIWGWGWGGEEWGERDTGSVGDFKQIQSRPAIAPPREHWVISGNIWGYYNRERGVVLLSSSK